MNLTVLSQYPDTSKIELQLVRVRYFLEDQQLIRESIKTDFPSPNETWHQQQILTGVTRVNFSFFFDRWESYLAHDKKIPIGNSLTIRDAALAKHRANQSPKRSRP